MLLRSRPARTANLARNFLAEGGRAERWRPARDALWQLLARHVDEGATVAVVGAGNGDDLPLTRLLARAERVDLLDLGRTASRRALRREPPDLRARGRVVRCDVTGGAADRIAAAAIRARPPRDPSVPVEPLGRYDVIVGDLLYTQLLYPALLDAGLSSARIGEALGEHGQALCDAVVARLHASAPVVVHLNDVLGWWPGHVPGRRPTGCDVEAAVARAGASVIERAGWHWPFGERVEYLVEATVAGPTRRARR